MNIEASPRGACFQCGKASYLGRILLLPQWLTVYCTNLTSKMQREEIAELRQDKVGTSFKIPASQKNQSDILGW